MIQSEDSAILQRLKDLKANATLLYKVSGDRWSVTEAVVQEMRSFSKHVTLQKGLIQQLFDSYMLNKDTGGGIVELFHKNNVTVFVSALRNIFVTLPFDYESNPIAEIGNMVNLFGVDGIMTDFPATVKAYLDLQDNNCLNNSADENRSYSFQPGALLTFLTRYMTPGYYIPQPPAPLLNITQAPLPAP